MAVVIRVPDNCTAITFSSSGAKVPVANEISGITADECRQCVRPESRPSLVTTNLTTGATDIKLPACITGANSITIAGVQYTPSASGVISAVPAAAATLFLTQNFTLVTGA